MSRIKRQKTRRNVKSCNNPKSWVMQFELCHWKTIACHTCCALKMEVQPKPGLNFAVVPLL